jgi:hypothetical protein
MSNKDYFSLFMDFRESLTLAMQQSELNTLYYAATRISSASEGFADICGYQRYQMKPTVCIPGIHLPGQKIVLTHGPGDALEKIDILSRLERYLGRPIDSS